MLLINSILDENQHLKWNADLEILSTMIFPNDSSLREQYTFPHKPEFDSIFALLDEHADALLPDKDVNKDNAKYQAEKLREISKISQELNENISTKLGKYGNIGQAKTSPHMFQVFRKNVERGYTVGDTLYWFCYLDKFFDDPSLGKAQFLTSHYYIKRYQQGKPSPAFSRDSIEKAWQVLSPVAPLWAAHSYLEKHPDFLSNKSDMSDEFFIDFIHSFNAPPDDGVTALKPLWATRKHLPIFIGLAKWFYDKGTTANIAGRKDVLLNTNNVYQLPTPIDLKNCAPTFNMDNQIIELVKKNYTGYKNTK